MSDYSLYENELHQMLRWLIDLIYEFVCFIGKELYPEAQQSNSSTYSVSEVDNSNVNLKNIFFQNRNRRVQI